MMVTMSPSQTESGTRYQEPEDSRIALLIPEEAQRAEAEEERATGIEALPELWVPPRKKGLPARIARRSAAFATSAFLYFDWLAEPPMTERDRVNRKIAKVQSEVYDYTQKKI